MTVRNQDSQTVRGATVFGSWYGLVSGTSSNTTSRTGTAAFTSSTSKGPGTFTFTFTFNVTGISLSGYTYAPDRNSETSDSVTTP